MKPILFALLFLLVPKFCISQVITANDDAVYLDSLFNMGNEKNYKYIRVVKDYHVPNQKSYEVKYFYKSGKIAISGITSTKDQITKTGVFVYYYENGNKKAITNFIKNVSRGKESIWYENGNKKQEGEYIIDEKKNESKYKVNVFWDANGFEKVTDGNGDYEESDENLFASGKVKNGFKDGRWEGSDKKIGYTFSENYENQKLVSGVSIDKEKTTHNYTVLVKKPEPKKGMANFTTYIARAVNSPKVEGLNGEIYVKFVVETDGTIADVKVLKDLGYGTGAEAFRAVTSYKDWTPAEYRGIKIRYTCSLPIVVRSK